MSVERVFFSYHGSSAHAQTPVVVGPIFACSNVWRVGIPIFRGCPRLYSNSETSHIKSDVNFVNFKTLPFKPMSSKQSYQYHVRILFTNRWRNSADRFAIPPARCLGMQSMPDEGNVFTIATTILHASSNMIHLQIISKVLSNCFRISLLCSCPYANASTIVRSFSSRPLARVCTTWLWAICSGGVSTSSDFVCFSSPTSPSLWLLLARA